MRKPVHCTILLTLIISLSQCTPEQAQTPSVSNTYSIPLQQAVNTLHPWSCNKEACGTVIAASHRRLFRYFKGRIQPDLVAAVEIQGSGKTILRLKRGVEFEDNTEFNAQFLADYFEGFKEFGRQTWILQGLESFRVLDPFSIELQHSVAFSLLQSRLALPQLSIFKDEKGKFLGLAGVQLNRKGHDIALKKTKGGAVSFKIISDPASRYFFFRSGDIDIYKARGIYRMMPYDINQVQRREVESLAVYYGAMVFDQGSALADTAFRSHLNAKFNREAICQKTLLNACLPLAQPVPLTLADDIQGETLWSVSSEVWPSEEINIYTPADRDRQLIARYLSNLLSELGMIAKLQVLENATLYRFNKEKKPGIYLLKWVADYPHAENFLMPLFYSKNGGAAGNRAWFQDAAIDKKLLSSSFNRSEVRELQQAIVKKAPWLFIGSQSESILTQKNTAGQVPDFFYEWHPALLAVSQD